MSLQAVRIDLAEMLGLPQACGDYYTQILEEYMKSGKIVTFGVPPEDPAFVGMMEELTARFHVAFKAPTTANTLCLTRIDIHVVCMGFFLSFEKVPYVCTNLSDLVESHDFKALSVKDILVTTNVFSPRAECFSILDLEQVKVVQMESAVDLGIGEAYGEHWPAPTDQFNESHIRRFKEYLASKSGFEKTVAEGILADFLTEGEFSLVKASQHEAH